jgi:hypothetical protein
MEADTAISENLVHGVDGGKDFVNHEELTDTDLSQKLFYEGITKVVGLLSQQRQSLCFCCGLLLCSYRYFVCSFSYE